MNNVIPTVALVVVYPKLKIENVMHVIMDIGE